MGIQWSVRATLEQPRLPKGNDKSRIGQDPPRIPVYQATVEPLDEQPGAIPKNRMDYNVAGRFRRL